MKKLIYNTKNLSVMLIILVFVMFFSGCKSSELESNAGNDHKIDEGQEGQRSEVPVLMIQVGEESFNTVSGGYSLDTDETEGVLILAKDEELISIKKLAAIELDFEEEPIRLSAKRWLVSREEINADGFNSKDLETEDVTIEGNWIRVQGGIIEAVYEIMAEFEKGQVSYAFAVKLEGGISDGTVTEPIEKEEEIANGKLLDISEIRDYFDVEIEKATYIGDYIHKQAEYEMTTVNGGTFGYRPMTNEIIQFGIGPTKHNGWSNVVSPIVRTIDYFTDYDGGRFVEASSYSGYTYYTSQKNIKLDDYTYLINEDQYVDVYNRLRELKELESVYETIDQTKIGSLDYNDTFIAYTNKGTNDLILVNRKTEERVTIGSIGSFYRLTGDQLLYQKNGEDYGLYSYEDGKERKILDYLVFDAVYIEGKLYYFDVDLNVYRVDLTGPVKITESQVTEYVFDDDYMILCQRDDMLHVLYKLINEELEFVRCLTLESMAIYDWHFTDGQEFYYNGSYEVSNTFSSSLDIGQDYGHLVYENDQVLVTYFSHYAYEFGSSTLQIYDKNKNKYVRIGDIWHLSGYRIEGDTVFIIGTDYGDRHDIVYKLDFKNYVYELVESIEPDKNEMYLIGDYSQEQEVKVIINQSDYDNNTMVISDLSGRLTFNEFKGNFQVLNLSEHGFYYVDYLKGVFYYDYKAKETIRMSGIDKSYRISSSPWSSLSSEYYLNELSQVVQINYDTGKVKVVLDKVIKNAMINNDNLFCIDEDNNLYYIGETPFMVHAFDKNEVLSDQLLYSQIIKIENQIIFIDANKNEIINYNMTNGLSNIIDLFWIDGQYSRVRVALSNGKQSYYISATNNNIWKEYLVNDTIINKMEENKKIIASIGFTDFVNSKVEQLKDDIYLVGLLLNEGDDYEYSIYNDKEDSVFNIEKQPQLLKDYYVSGNELQMFYGTTSTNDDIKYFPYKVSYDLSGKGQAVRDNYIYVNKGYDDFIIGGDANKTNLEKVIINEDGFTLDLGPTSQTNIKGDSLAPYTEFRNVSGAISIIVSNLNASYDQFEGLKELGFIGEYHIDKVNEWTYLYFVYNNIQAFTCDFEVGDDGFIDYRFIFK